MQPIKKAFTQSSKNNQKDNYPKNLASYFSPNGDGVRDTIVLKPSFLRNNVVKNIKKWELYIVEPTADGNVVARIFSQSAYNSKEQGIIWDGTSEAIEQKGSNFITTTNYSKAISGLYYYTFKITDTNNKAYETPFLPIVLDTIQPRITVNTDKIFSPNGDEFKEKLPLSIRAWLYRHRDTIHVLIADESGKVVQKIKIPTRIVLRQKNQHKIWWDGKDNNGAKMPQGNYYVYANIIDRAQNSFTTKKKGIVLIRDFEKVKIIAKQPYFRYNQSNDTLQFLLERPTNLLQKQIFSIVNSDGKKIHRQDSISTHLNKINISYDELPFEFSSKKSYKALLEVFYQNGNVVRSSIDIPIDNTAPVVSVSKDGENFVIGEGTHNGKRAIMFNVLGKDNQELELIGRVRAVKEGKDGKRVNGKIVYEKKFEVAGAETNINFSWDGTTGEGLSEEGLAEEGLVGEGLYELEVEAKDGAGNVARAKSGVVRAFSGIAVASIKASSEVLSPNGDGVLDKMVFSVKMDEPSRARLKSGVLTIEGFGRVLDTNSIDGKSKEIEFDPIAKWGKSTDGAYKYKYIFEFASGERVEGKGNFVVDTQSYVPTHTEGVKTISPNGDGVLDSFSVKLGAASVRNFVAETKLGEVILRAEVKDSKGRVVYKKTYEQGDELEKGGVITWNGTTTEGEAVADGNYEFQLVSEDKAKNRWQSAPAKISVLKEVKDLKLLLVYRLQSPFFNLDKDKVALNYLINSNQQPYISKINYYFVVDGKTNVYSSPHTNAIILSQGSNQPWSIEGKYTVWAKVHLQHGVAGVSKPTNFIIDNTAPVVSVSKDGENFVIGEGTHNGKRAIMFNVLGKDNQELELIGRVRAVKEGKDGKRVNGKIVYEKKFEVAGAETNINFSWDGTTGEGLSEEGLAEEGLVGEGLYELEVEAKDGAGNVARAKSGVVRAFSGIAVASIKASSEVLSPNGDGVLDKMVFSVKMDEPSRARLKSGVLTIEGFGRVLDTNSIDGKSKEIEFDPIAKWGKSTDGAYKYKYIFEFASGERVEGKGNFVVDTQSYVPTHTEGVKTISPNGDGVLDSFSVKLGAASVRNFVAETKLGEVILRAEVKDSKGRVVYKKTYEQGDELEKGGVITWNGTTTEGEAVADGNYEFQLVSEDKAKNRWQSAPAKISVLKELSDLELSFTKEVEEGQIVNLANAELELESSFGSKADLKKDYRLQELIYYFVMGETTNKYAQKELGQVNLDVVRGRPWSIEGEYVVWAEARFAHGFSKRSEELTLSIDNTAPVVSVSKDGENFVIGEGTHNGKRAIMFNVLGKDNQELELIGRVRAVKEGKDGKRVNGKIVYEKKFEVAGAETNINFSWDGTTGEGLAEEGLAEEGLVGEGLYELEVEAKDGAGNVARAKSGVVRAFSGIAVASIKASSEVLSPNGDGVLDKMVFSVKMDEPSRARLKSGVLTIEGFGRVLDTNSIDGKSKEIEFDPIAKWGKSTDGAYKYKYIFEFASGERVEGKGNFVVDTQSYVPTHTEGVKTISPNGDGVLDSFSVKLGAASVRNFVAETKLGEVILRAEVKDSKGRVVYKKTYEQGDELEKGGVITWNGTTTEGEAVADGNYEFQLVSEDKAKNRWQSAPAKISVLKELSDLELSFTKEVEEGQIVNLANAELELESSFGSKADLKKDYRLQELIYYFVMGETTNKYAQKELGQVNLDVVRGRPWSIEGEYVVWAEARFAHGFSKRSEELTLSIDNTAPVVSVSKDGENFVIGEGTHNGKRAIMFNVLGKDNQELELIGRVRAVKEGKDGKRVNGKIVYEKKFEVAGAETNINFSWDGTTGEGLAEEGLSEEGLVGEGLYELEVEAKDGAGNVARAKSGVVRAFSGIAVASIKASSEVLSPNGDGVLDKMVFSVKMDEPSRARLKSGVLTIEGFGRVLDTNSIDGKSKEIEFDPIAKWGKSTDGAYKYKYIFEFASGERVEGKGNFVVDTQSYVPTHTEGVKTISPNGDGVLDSFSVKLGAASVRNFVAETKLGEVILRAEVKDSKGRVVYKKTYEQGDELEKGGVITWNGTTTEGEAVADGNYEFQLVSEDKAKNRWQSAPAKISVLKEVKDLKLLLVYRLQSPFFNLDKDKVALNYLINSNQQPYISKINYYFVVDGKTNVYSSPHTNAIILSQGSNQPWSMEGKYTVWAKVHLQHGVVGVSKPVQFTIDDTPPELNITIKESYSHVGGGTNEVFSINVAAVDNDPAIITELMVYSGGDFKDGVVSDKEYLKMLANKNNEHLLQTWQWTGSISTNLDYVVWDDKQLKNSKIKTGTDYALILRTVDSTGNEKVVVKKIKVGFLVQQDKDGDLKIIYNAINFIYNSDKMVGKYQENLNQFIVIMNTFSQYNIHIEGHTDSRGTDEYNQQLSDKRAQAVYEYFVDGGIEPERLTIQGMGESELMVKNEIVKSRRYSGKEKAKLTELNYQKNRRAEFFLKINKKQEANNTTNQAPLKEENEADKKPTEELLKERDDEQQTLQKEDA